jgi:cellulose synthase/poly-beta-1,6-N-acetylglucosamine synthase-like glycosyltransferase
MGIFLLCLYVFAMGFILLYSMSQLHLAYVYSRFQKRGKKQHEALPAEWQTSHAHGEEWPYVTVQLPVFNEMYVVERLIDAVADFDYPKDRFEIQVLDDSTDQTVDITARKVAEVRAGKGVNITQVRRPNRQGFKAGALADGLREAKGEFIAIFDADFVPPPDFLRNTIPHFDADNIGVVQTRWTHINIDYSILTRLQAFALDAHFSVEQQGRNAAGYFMNFNGTAGVWRRKCIEDAGGWQSDTLTEDLDLSYRAQLKGWKFKFMENLESPAELPAAMGAIKSQQFRWTKGAAETARKNLWNVLRAKLPMGIKIHAVAHLLNSFLFICILMTSLLSVPLLYYKVDSPTLTKLFDYASIFILSLFSLIIFFWVSRTNRETGPVLPRFLKFLATFPVFLALSMGLSLHNAIATLEGYLGIKSPFIRTPKFNIKDVKDNWKTRTQYLSKSISPVTVLEGLFSLYFIGGMIMDIYYGEYALLPFHFLLLLGYSSIFYYSIRHSLAPSA